MKLDIGSLRRFESRVRMIRAWKGLAIGLTIGGIICTGWAALDWARMAYTEWAWMGLVLAVMGMAGMATGFLLKVPTRALTDSIDRRGALANRLTTSMEVAEESTFGLALHDDAQSKLAGLKPNELYPLKMGRWQAGAIGMVALASTIFLLGNSPLLLPPRERKDREELKKIGQSVERIARPLTETEKPGDLTDAEKRMADELRKLQRDLQRNRLSKEEAVQEANELNKKTKEIVKDRADLTNQNLEKAESALEKLQKAELEKNGVKMDAEMMKQLREMNQSNDRKGDPNRSPDQQIDQKLRELEQQQKGLEQQKAQVEQKKSDLLKQLDKINQDLKNPNLTAEQRKALEAMQKKIQEMLKKLEKEIEEIQKAVNKILQNKEIQELLKKINEHPAMKKLQEMAAKLAANAKMGENGEMPEITKEDLKELMDKMPELEQKLKDLAKKLQDPKALDEYMEALKEALENMDQLELNAGLCLGCIGLFGLPINLPGIPSPGNPIDFMGVDTHQINKDPNGKQGAGSTKLTQIKGERQKDGDETYIEIKGPTTIGNRSGVKYTKVLPSYKRKAEQAIERKTIPKQHEKRVKEYFESLSGGK